MLMRKSNSFCNLIGGASMLNNKENPPRLYYLDWIRVIVVLLIIPFHSAVSFSHIGKAYIYTPYAIESPLYIFISDFLNLWFMRMLFFISGISTYISFKRRNSREYIKERFRRLLLPVLFMLLTVGPLSGYILAMNHFNFTGSFLSFYPYFFINYKKYLFWGHMWFCVYLFTFSLIAAPFFNRLIKSRKVLERFNTILSKGNNVFLPMLLIIAFEMIFRPFYPGYQSLIGDWANFTVHLSFFILGFLIGDNLLTHRVIEKKIYYFLTGAIVSALVYIIVKRVLSYSSYKVQLILSMLWAIAAYTWVMFFIALSKKILSYKNRLLHYLSNSSFSLYMFHYYIITLLNLYLFRTGINHYLNWFLTSVVTYLLFLLLFEMVLKRVKPLRYICGIR